MWISSIHDKVKKLLFYGGFFYFRAIADNGDFL